MDLAIAPECPLLRPHLIATNVFGRKGQQGQVPGSFDCDGQPALMFGARTCLATGSDLAAIGQETPQRPHILIVDHFGLFQAEGTHLAAWGIATPVASTSTSAA
jgi:hypothetical protein